MKLKRIFIFFVAACLPLCLYSESDSTSTIADALNEQIVKLENLQIDLQKQAELLMIQNEQLKAAELNLIQSQEVLQKTQEICKQLSSDLEKSQKRLKTWKIISIVSMTATVLTGTSLIITLATN